MKDYRKVKSMLEEKKLPQHIEEEKIILGVIIANPEMMDQVTGYLEAEDFFQPEHKVIYGVLKEYHNQHIPSDFISLCDQLEKDGTLESAGGPAYISSLVCKAPDTLNLKSEIKMVLKSADNRRLYSFGEWLLQIAEDEESTTDAFPDKLLRKFQQLVLRGEPTVTDYRRKYPL